MYTHRVMTRQGDGQTDGQTDRKRDGQADTSGETERQTDTQRVRHTVRQLDTQAKDRHTDSVFTEMNLCVLIVRPLSAGSHTPP